MHSDLPPAIGRYVLDEPLGQGGMGRVVLAHDTVLGRKVALKLLRADLGLPPETRATLFERMRVEARAAAGVSHPNVVVLHDMGEDDALGLYLVFEYVEGPTLRERLRRGPLTPDEASELARALGAALAAAHAKGVVHRDVKPENVLLAPTGPKIADFGIARVPDSTLTAAGQVLGTPAYSAPEALARGEFSPASDQFGLAATLYEAITGRRAFPGDDPIQVASRIAFEQPARVVDVSPLGRALERVDAHLGRGLAKDPDARFPSCAALGEAVANALDVAAHPGPGPRDPGSEPTPLSAPPASTVPSSILALARRSIVPRATRRVHNLVAAAGLVVIVALFLFGRRARGVDEIADAGTDAAAPATVVPGTASARSAAPSARRPSGRPAASAAARDAGGSTLTSEFPDAGDGVGFAAEDAGTDAALAVP